MEKWKVIKHDLSTASKTERIMEGTYGQIASMVNSAESVMPCQLYSIVPFEAMGQ